MAAVGAYLMPNGMFTSVDFIKNSSRGYVLQLSQWQKWDIFSPNPLRRVSDYAIERDAGDRWETEKVLTFDSLPWWKRAKELKVLGRLEEDRWLPLTEPFLRTYCKELPKASGKRIRLVAHSIVLPFRLHELRMVGTTFIPPTSTILGTASCPRST